MICGLSPDLDILLLLNDPVTALTYHRGPSQSFFVGSFEPLFYLVDSDALEGYAFTIRQPKELLPFFARSYKETMLEV